MNALENNSAFNAGHGAVLTEEGTVEMDAIVVDGDSGKTGKKPGYYINDNNITLKSTNYHTNIKWDKITRNFFSRCSHLCP